MIRKLWAELIGTFVLVFCGLGGALLGQKTANNMHVALSFGLALLVMVYVIGPISGCHINPAVTLGALLTRKIDSKNAGGYVAAQLIGAFIGAALVFAIAQGMPGGFAAAGMAPNGYGPHSPAGYSLAAGFLAETVLTMLLVLTVLGSTDVKAPVGFAGIAIGLMLTVAHLVAIPITNASINPARSIASALFVGGWALQQLWLFVIAPLVGAAVASGIFALLRPSIKAITLREGEESLPGQQKQRAERPVA